MALADVLLPQCQPEVRNERLAAPVEQDVPGLDIAMDQPLLVRVVQRLGHGRHQFGRPGIESPDCLILVARSVPSMYFETTKQGNCSVLPTSKTGTMWG